MRLLYNSQYGDSIRQFHSSLHKRTFYYRSFYISTINMVFWITFMLVVVNGVNGMSELRLNELK